MENVPKIVRERLRIASIAAHHPDADMLAAFAERSLVEAERTTVLEHLARCGECRDVVALALPAIEAAGAPVSPDRGRWLAWPVLRWGFAVAGLAIIASLGIVHLQRRSPAMTAGKAVQFAATEARNQTLPAVATSTTAREGNKKNPPVPDLAEPQTSAPMRGAPQVASGSASGQAPLPHGLKQAANEFQPQNPNALAGKIALVAPPPTAKRQTSNQLGANARIASSAGAVEVQPSAPTNPEPQNLDLQSATSAEPTNYGEEKVGRAKEPTDTTVAHSEGTTAANSEVISSSPTARWAITSAGGLQRSLDQGHSWQGVNVKTSPAESGFDAQASPTPANGRDATDNVPIVFRAVAANGPEVWAGGSGRQLYHSIDAGNHWSKVLPSAGDAALTGDVVGVEFVDQQHGRVSTSTSEVWITSDDGATWQKQ